MENPQKRGRQYYDDRRRLLKHCFRYNTKQREVPFEIWQDIIKNADLKVIALCTQLSKGFKQLVESVNCMDLVMKYKRIDQIQISLKYLKMLCNDNHPEALMHLGMAYWMRGWGVEQSNEKACECFSKSGSLGNCVAMVLFAYIVLFVKKSIESDLAYTYIEYVLKSDDKLALGLYYCHFADDDDKASEMFLYSAIDDNNEYAQYWLALTRTYNDENLPSYYWFKRSADQEYGPAIYVMYTHYSYKGAYWKKKAKLQNMF